MADHWRCLTVYTNTEQKAPVFPGSELCLLSHHWFIWQCNPVFLHSTQVHIDFSSTKAFILSLSPVLTIGQFPILSLNTKWIQCVLKFREWDPTVLLSSFHLLTVFSTFHWPCSPATSYLSESVITLIQWDQQQPKELYCLVSSFGIAKSPELWVISA